MATTKNYWRCNTCKCSFKLQLGLENHRKRKICSKMSDLRNRNPMEIIEERFLCDSCCTSFWNFSSFYLHKLNCSYRVGYMSRTKSYWRCDSCKSTFKLQLGLENHKRRKICRKILDIRNVRDCEMVVDECMIVTEEVVDMCMDL